jgi:sugar lactone lactonase YvrE
MKSFSYLIVPAAFCGCFLGSVVAAQTLEKAWETPADFKGPESALYDAQRDVIYVSNVNGAPNEADGNGFISKISLDGTITELEWVGGLNAPKGLAMTGDKLYVSDINMLVEIDAESGAVSNSYEAADAQFLNDVTADDAGNVYVSDMMTNTIYKLSDGQISAWVQSDELENPNGLLAEGDKLIVGAWGKMTDGFNTEVPGHLKAVSLSDGSISSLGNATPVGNLDGVEADGQGSYYVTDWMNGKLLHIDADGNANEMLALGQGSADHEVVLEKNLVLIPMMMNNTVQAYTIK